MPPPRKCQYNGVLSKLGKLHVYKLFKIGYSSNLSHLKNELPIVCKSRYAFTLAEVLITLGIIGVVAAMTMPSLTQSSRKQETSARLKKFYSIMSQAIIRSELDNESSLYWERNPSILQEDGEYDNVGNEEITYNFFMKYLAPYITYTKLDRGYNEVGAGIDGADLYHILKIYLNDSSTMDFYNGGCLDIVYDTNGDRKPNIEGQDKYRFLYCNSPSNTAHTMTKNQAFSTYMINSSLVSTREKAIEICKTNAAFCSTLLQKYDNWEFKEDYPHRL